MAGTVPIKNENQRAPTVRPRKEFDDEEFYLLHAKPDEEGVKEVEDKGIDHEQWLDLVKKVEEPETRLAEQFDDSNGQVGHSPPIVKAPVNPTQEEWEQHQTTHTLRGVVQALCGSTKREKESP